MGVWTQGWGEFKNEWELLSYSIQLKDFHQVKFEVELKDFEYVELELEKKH